MFLKASCTVVECKAEVWKKDNLFSVKGTGHVSGHGLQMAQVALPVYQHDDDVAVRVVTQLLQPALHILLCQVLGDFIQHQCIHCTVVVSRGDGAVALLASSVPTLAFMVLLLTWSLQVANSMPMVLLLSRLNFCG